MPAFSTRSLERLQTCHTDIQTLFHEVIKHFDCTILEGHRNEASQNAAFAAGRSKLRFPQSKHNQQPALAVDVVPYPINWNDTDRMRYFAGFVQGLAVTLKQQGRISHSIRWGGDWDRDTELHDNRFMDFPHFELY